jgi:hypothetical protein
MNIDEREQRLLELVREYEEQECRELLDKARADASALLGQSARRARSVLHARILSERANVRERIHAAHAERDTRLRVSAEQANLELIALAWPRLQAALKARWDDADGRSVWVATVVQQAQARLPDVAWTIRHPPDWPRSEWLALAQRLAVEQAQPVRFVADGALTAGLVIESEGASLDASLGGLLSDRRRLEARLLAVLAQTAAEDRSTP